MKNKAETEKVIMRKVKSYKFRIMFILLTVLSISSCSKDEDLGNLNETITIRHKGADMPAYIHGNGSEKVFLITLHGGPGGLGLGLRSSAFKAVENTCAVVYFDQRGSGMAQGNYSNNGISVDIMAEDILALVKVIKHKYGSDSRFFLLGLSWGGTLGIATILKDQNKFLGWIQVDGTHNPKGMYLEYKANFKRVAAEQIALGNSIDYWNSVNKLLLEVDNTFNQSDFRRLNSKAHEAEKRLVDDNVFNKPNGPQDLFFDYNLITFLWNARNTQSILDPEIRNLSYANRLSEIKIPSLILWGKHDMVVPPSFAQEAYDGLGSSVKRMVIFEKSGHTPMFSEADLFEQELLLFINQQK